jgi:hypothetical protein
MNNGDAFQADDFKAYVSDVPKKASVTAYINDTGDGVRLRHRNKIYEIPNKHLQDGIPAQYGEINETCKGLTQKTQQIKKRKDGTLCVVERESSDKDAISWKWRERLQPRIDRLVNDSVTVQPNDPEFKNLPGFNVLSVGGRLPVEFIRNQANPETTWAGVVLNKFHDPQEVLRTIQLVSGHFSQAAMRNISEFSSSCRSVMNFANT